MIAIIDYGMGNLHSVKKALQLYGAETRITNKAREIRSADKIVMPGVGAFNDAMAELKKQGLISCILEHLKNKKPFLGICLGMQLLFNESEEASRLKGLGFIKGRVRKFGSVKELKVPHIGWNQLKIKKKNCPLFRGVPDKSYVYFCHSYYPEASDRNTAAATTEYGIDFASVVWQDNIYGMQFHPEKSQQVGLKIVENFVKL